MILFYRQEFIKLGYHPVKFGGHKHSDNGDIMVLVCHVISQDHVIKGLYDFEDRSLSREVIILLSLVAIETVVVEK